MGQLEQKTCERIWKCHREIETAEHLLSEMEKLRKEAESNRDPHVKGIDDAFGYPRDLQLGIPSGHNSSRLFNVSPVLALSVIKAHISNQKADLVELNESARIELEIDVL